MTIPTTRYELTDAIQQHLFVAPWTPDQQRSLEWQGVLIVLTPEVKSRSEIQVTMSIHLDDRYGTEPLSGVRLQAEVFDGLAIARLDFVPGSTSTYRCIFSLGSVLQMKFTLI